MKSKLVKREQCHTHNHNAAGPRPFTGLLFCPCGHVYHSRKSKNAKGEYRYWLCGAQSMYDRCKDTPRLREDALLAKVRDGLAGIFAKSDRIIARALELARAETRQQRDESTRLRQEIADADAAIIKLTRLLADAADEPAARKAIVRQIGAAETRRDALQASVAPLADTAMDSTDKLAAAVQRAFERAREDFAKMLTPAEIHAVMERYLGKCEVQPDGKLIRQTETPPANAEGVSVSYIEGVPPCSSGR